MHGFSENELILWRYPSMIEIPEFTGHIAQVSEVKLCLQFKKTTNVFLSHVLHMKQSPNGACIVSAAAEL